jgi:hypothetical protein
VQSIGQAPKSLCKDHMDQDTGKDSDQLVIPVVIMVRLLECEQLSHWELQYNCSLHTGLRNYS